MLDLDSYFKRVGYSGPRTATLETLCALQALHPRSIPFENLDTLSGRPVALDLSSLEHKLVQSRRGGYCFEQNLLFKHVLNAVGFDAAALAARVVWERPADELRARTHMVLLVTLERAHVELNRRTGKRVEVLERNRGRMQCLQRTQRLERRVAPARIADAP